MPKYCRVCAACFADDAFTYAPQHGWVHTNPLPHAIRGCRVGELSLSMSRAHALRRVLPNAEQHVAVETVPFPGTANGGRRRGRG